MRTIWAIAPLLVASSAAPARQYPYPPPRASFAITLQDAGGNANGVVEPGEVVAIRVAATVDPPIGAWTTLVSLGWGGHSGKTYAFAASLIDVTGTHNSASGSLAYTVPPPLNVGISGTLNPTTQSVVDSNAGQLVFLPTLPGSQANPIDVFEGTWTPNGYGARTLGYRVTIDAASVYVELPLLPQPVGDTPQTTGSEATISIVPGPGSAWLLSAAGGIAYRRRRAS